MATDSAPAPAARISGIAPPPLRPEQVRRTILLVVDDLALRHEGIVNVREAILKFTNTLQSGDLVALMRTSAGSGALQLRTAVRDLAGGATGSASEFVLAPDLRNRKLALSGLVVAPLRDAGDRLRLVTRQFQPGEEVAYSVQVLSAPPAAKLSMRVRLYAEGQPLFETPEKALSGPDAASGVIRLSKDIAPGEYALEMIVTARTTSQVRELAQWTDLRVH